MQFQFLIKKTENNSGPNSSGSSNNITDLLSLTDIISSEFSQT